MVNQLRLKLLGATLFTFVLINCLEIHVSILNQGTGLDINRAAQARSSGGRSGGGSFNKRSSSSSNSNNSSSSSRSDNSRGSSGTYSPSHRYRKYPVGGNIIIISGDGSDYSGSYNLLNGSTLLFLGTGLVGAVGLVAAVNGVKSAMKRRRWANNISTVERERDNDTVTISKLQVALLANAVELQSQLTQLSLEVNTSTDEGLVELLRESALLLLRNSAYWSHALASSESWDINHAEGAFNRFSVEELSKFSTETLTNVDGNLKQKKVDITEDEIAAYIVVTLLTGTADDQPLFGQIHSTEELQSALEKLASLRSDYLMRFELLWSPQTEDDSLTYDELLTEYTNMVQIV